MVRMKLTAKEGEGGEDSVKNQEWTGRKLQEKEERPPSPVHHPSPARKPSPAREVEKTVEEAERQVEEARQLEEVGWSLSLLPT